MSGFEAFEKEVGWQPDDPIQEEEPVRKAPLSEDKLRAQLASLTNSAANLQHQTFAPLQYVLARFIPEGLTLVAGKPKVGKSFLCLDIAIAVAQGGYCLGKQCEPGDVMALFLEDTDRRMQRRIDRMLGMLKADWPPRLRYATQFNRMDDGGLEMLRLWAKESEHPRLIIVDLWERFRPLPQARNGSQYRSDYADLIHLQKLAAEFPGLGILVTNHQRKATAEDIFDTISGTLGLNGGADTLMVLAREEGAKTLEVRGRDITDCAVVVEQDEKTLRFKNLGARHAGASTPERKKIIDAMRGRGPMSTKEIHKAVGGSYDAVKNLLCKMHMDEAIHRAGKWGTYVLPQQEKGNGDAGDDPLDHLFNGEALGGEVKH
jgi:hypothetical protein